MPLAVQDVPAEGRHVDLATDASVRTAVAKLAAVREITQLDASFDVTPYRGDGLHVTGQVVATVGQDCVVTLEPMESRIDESIDVTFIPPHAAVAESADSDAIASDDDQPETLVDGVVDLGALATEFLLLAIDPYPRRPDAVFAPPQPDTDPSAHPFAALAALKKSAGDD
jgi:uncharacterized metal-binding protein YceD (DUF177 family)